MGEESEIHFIIYMLYERISRALAEPGLFHIYMSKPSYLPLPYRSQHRSSSLVASATLLIYEKLSCLHITDLWGSSVVTTLSDGLEIYSFLLQIIKSILTRHSEMLETSLHLPELPAISGNPRLEEDFRMFFASQHWHDYIREVVSNNTLSSFPYSKERTTPL